MGYINNSAHTIKVAPETTLNTAPETFFLGVADTGTNDGPSTKGASVDGAAAGASGASVGPSLRGSLVGSAAGSLTGSATGSLTGSATGSAEGVGSNASEGKYPLHEKITDVGGLPEGRVVHTSKKL